MSKLLDWLKVLPVLILPKHGLSRLVFHITRIQFKPFKNFLIKTFIRVYKVDMKQAIWPDAVDYQSFNAFFTRKLNPEARQWQKDNNLILSPVDGAVSEIGQLDNDSIIQAKGMSYSLTKLLANETEATERLMNGNFATLYLSPRDYHRIHMPLTAQLVKSIYVPGDLYAVNTASVRTVKQLFARNERFISLFETDIGLMAQIMVGAIFVGSMETVWLGQITPTKHRVLTAKEYDEDEILLNQGEEFGRFNMGSTVILVVEENKLSWLNELETGTSIQVGQTLGNVD